MILNGPERREFHAEMIKNDIWLWDRPSAHLEVKSILGIEMLNIYFFQFPVKTKSGNLRCNLASDHELTIL